MNVKCKSEISNGMTITEFVDAIELKKERKIFNRYNDLDSIIRYLLPDERRLLQLLRIGKKFREIAEIIGIRDKRCAFKEVSRLYLVVNFYLRWKDLFGKFESTELPNERKKFLSEFILERKSYIEISELRGISKEDFNKQLLSNLIFLRRNGYEDIADLVSAVWKFRRLRPSMRSAVGVRREWNGKRRAEMLESWRYDCRDTLLSLVGKVYYQWGGQNIRKGVADCSGLVIEVLTRVGKLPENFRDMNAQGLYAYFGPWDNNAVESPSLCDLAFYGKNTKSISHVMFYLGSVDKTKIRGKLAHSNDLVIGMCGGAKDMLAEDAKLLGAGLWVRKSVRYRSDFVGFRRVS